MVLAKQWLASPFVFSQLFGGKYLKESKSENCPQKKYSGIKLFTIAQLIATMSSRTAARLLAISQARSKMEELTKKEVVSFAFILTDDGPELIGEEDLVTELMGVFEEKDIIQHAQLIKLRGQAVNHRSTRTIKLQQMQEAFDTQLPPSPLPLGEMVDYGEGEV